MRDTFQARSTRDAILDATDRMLAAGGYKKMTIDDLAREVGIGKGSIYLHFSSKEEIALSHIDRIVERLKARLDEISREDATPEVRLRKMLLARVMIRLDSVQHYSQSLNEMLSYLRPKLLERRKRYFEGEAQILAIVIREGQKGGQFTKTDPLEAARTMVTATNSLLPYSLSAVELGERDEVVDRATKLAELLIGGLKKK